MLPIARGIEDSESPDEIAKELSEILLGKVGKEGRDNFSYVIYKYASALRHTTTQKTTYKSLPSKNDAEFAVLQAMLLLNYLINTLKTAGLRS